MTNNLEKEVYLTILNNKLLKANCIDKETHRRVLTQIHNEYNKKEKACS